MEVLKGRKSKAATRKFGATFSVEHGNRIGGISQLKNLTELTELKEDGYEDNDESNL